MFNMMHCVAHGHEIVALGHLVPSLDELDSYMYQSVGYECIPYVAECLEIPLYQEKITGKSISLGMDYEQDQGDEVEDLYRLLVRVQQDFPDVDAVAAGAILSDYQRRRVVHVAERLGLQVMAYLWQADQPTLVQSMLDCQLEIMLLKVASMGLDQRFVGKILDHDILATFKVLSQKWGINVAGEGGEYESLVLDCPLYKSKKISIDRFEIVLHSAASKDAPVYYLKPLQISLIQKMETSATTQDSVDWASLILSTKLKF